MAKKKKFNGNRVYRFPKRIERNYNTLINNLMKPVVKEALKHVDDIEVFQQVLKNAFNSPTFKLRAKAIVRQISTSLLVEDEKNWRAAAAKSSRGREIKKALEREIEGNVKQRMEELFNYNATLIQTLPLTISENVIKHINSQAWVGRRASEIEEEIKKFFPVNSKASAKLIARTETSKFSSAITQARAEDIGLMWYEWCTSEDIAVRSSHRLMSGVFIHYRHPCTPERLDPKTKLKKYPQPYHAGNIYNCRCYQAPTEIEDMNFPIKVYDWIQNKIVTVSRERFLELNRKG